MFHKSALLCSVLTGPLLLASCNLTDIGASGTRPISVRGSAATENCPELHVREQEEDQPQTSPFVFKEQNAPGYFRMVGNNHNLTFDATCVKGNTVTGRSVLKFTVKADRPGRVPTPVDVRIVSPERVEGTPSRGGYTLVEGQYPPVITVTLPE